MKNPPLFHEVQHFRQWWIYLALLLVLAAGLWPVYDALILKHLPAYGDGQEVPLWVIALIPIAVASLILNLQLATSITREGILVRFPPFVNRFISWDEVDKAYVRTYRPILEYGGWGIRFGAGGSRAYNISGNQGLQLVLKNGKKILIGTQKPESLALVLRNLGFPRP